MTPEELAAKMEELIAKNAELEARIPVPPKPEDPDEKYKPATWKDLDERETRKAEEAAVKALEDAERRREAAKEKEEKELQAYHKRIDDAFEKLEKDGVIDKTEKAGDAGAMQRRQILGSLVRSGGQNVETEALKLRSAWEAGLEYDDQSNAFVRSGSGPSASRDQFVASSAGRTPTPIQKGPINTAGVRGDLDEAQRRWELGNKA